MKIWGDDIDQGSRDQIKVAAELPIARGAALMPDAHLGYGLPIGGVLATEGSVIPYGVGVDIACRMRLSITNAYKDIDAVMECQKDLVETVGRFDPKIVLMSGDGRAED